MEELNNDNQVKIRKNPEQSFTGKKSAIRRRRRHVYEFYQKGYSPSQIVKELDVSLSTIEKDLFKLRQYSFVLLGNLLDSGMVESTVNSHHHLVTVRNEYWKKYREGRVEDRLKILSKIADVSYKIQKMYGFDPAHLKPENLDQMGFEIMEYESDLEKEVKIQNNN